MTFCCGTSIETPFCPLCGRKASTLPEDLARIRDSLNDSKDRAVIQRAIDQLNHPPIVIRNFRSELIPPPADAFRFEDRCTCAAGYVDPVCPIHGPKATL